MHHFSAFIAIAGAGSHLLGRPHRHQHHLAAVLGNEREHRGGIAEQRGSELLGRCDNMLGGTLVGREFADQVEDRGDVVGARWSDHHRLFYLAPTSVWTLSVVLLATVLAVATPIRIWNSARIEHRLQEQEKLLLAAKAGATFISPFVGRLDDIGQDGMDLISDICQIYSQYPNFETEVLVASVRHPVHVVAAAKMGAHVATVPPAILRQLYNHPLTDKGLAAFLADWAKTGQSIL